MKAYAVIVLLVLVSMSMAMNLRKSYRQQNDEYEENKKLRELIDYGNRFDAASMNDPACEPCAIGECCSYPTVCKDGRFCMTIG